MGFILDGVALWRDTGQRIHCTSCFISFDGVLQCSWMVFFKMFRLDVSSSFYLSFIRVLFLVLRFSRPIVHLHCHLPRSSSRSLAEISTIFLNFRWFLLTLEQKNTLSFNINSILFALTFFVTRIFIGAWGLYDVWRNKAHWETGSYGVHGVVVGFHLIFIMNIFCSLK